MFSVGGIVISKRGRDKGNPFVIVAVEGEYLWLVDGRLRKLSKPKKKKAMHVQITNTVSVIGVTDSDFRKVLSRFQRNEEV